MVHILSGETDPDLHQLGLASVFKPITYSSIIFGLAWKRSPTKWCDIHTVHSTVLLLMMWTLALRYFMAYSKEERYGAILFHKIIMNIWVMQLAGGVSTFTYSKYRSIPSFVRDWENYKIKYGGVALSFMKKLVFRRVVFITVIVAIFMLVSSITWITVRPPLFTQWMFPLLSKPEDGQISKGIFIFGTFLVSYTMLVWLQCALSTLCYCSLLKHEFNQLSSQFPESVQNKAAQRNGYANLQSSNSPFCNDNNDNAEITTSGLSVPTSQWNERHPAENVRHIIIHQCSLLIG